MSVIISIRDLVKQFPKVRAVDSISFDVPEGICFGLLGPNGAGKTTSIEMMEGIIPITSGEILYKGKPLGRRFKEEVGIQFQSTTLPEKLTCREVIAMFGSMYQKKLPVATLIDQCDLNDFADRDAKKLSGGQQQRMLLAAALVNDPNLVFLDEPTTGLDPQARQTFWKIVRRIKAQGKTLILTTHYMEEAHVLCDEIVIMNKGKIIAQGNPIKLLQKYFSGATLHLPWDDQVFTALPTDLNAHRHNDLIEMHVNNLDISLKKLMEKQINLDRLTVQTATLEDLFIHVTNNKESS